MKQEQGEAVATGTQNETGRRVGEGARKRAAVELVRNHDQALRRTARRYSLCEDDADDAYQRALEILLTKAPTADQRDLIRWTQTVVKHEALAVRSNRERTLATPSGAEGSDPEQQDWVQLLPSERDGPADLAERRERVARSREALQALKPQELRALTLLAEGYSYDEIGDITGFSRTKINRCLAEGRGRFRALISSSESGDRCAALEPQLSAFCDGEAGPDEVTVLREHLHACAHCRATLRAYRAAPKAAAALAPVLPVSRSLFERGSEALAALQARLPGRTGAVEAAAAQVATGGGGRGTGMAAMTKLLALCAGTAGGAACVASGVAPVPLADVGAEQVKAPATVRAAPELPVAPVEQPVAAPVGVEAPAEPSEEKPSKPAQEAEPAPEPAPTPPPSVEFSPEASVSAAPAPAPAPVSSSSGSGSDTSGGGSTSAPSGGGSAAGEFGP